MTGRRFSWLEAVGSRRILVAGNACAGPSYASDMPGVSLATGILMWVSCVGQRPAIIGRQECDL